MGSLDGQKDIPDTIIVGVGAVSRCGSTTCDPKTPVRKREVEKNPRRDFLRGGGLAALMRHGFAGRAGGRISGRVDGG